MQDKEGSLLASWVPLHPPLPSPPFHSPLPVDYFHAGVPSLVWGGQQLVADTAPALSLFYSGAD